MSDPLILVALITANRGRGDDLLVAAERLVAETLRQDGCLGYSFNRDVENPDVFVVIERWRDHDTRQAHWSSAPMNAFRDAGRSGIFDDIAAHRLNRVAGRW